MQALEEIFALTDAVELHVERGEWTEAGALDAERCRLLAGLLADPAGVTDRAALREVLQSLLMRNQQTTARVQARQQALAQSTAALDLAPIAVRAYERNTATGTRIYLRTAQGSAT